MFRHLALKTVGLSRAYSVLDMVRETKVKLMTLDGTSAFKKQKIFQYNGILNKASESLHNKIGSQNPWPLGNF